MSKAVTAAIACGICMSVGLAPLFIGTFPLFLQPVSNELGWGAAIYPQAALVAGTASALIGPVIGHLIDRFGVRPLMFIGLVSWAGCLFGFSVMNGWQFQMLALSVLMGITAAACGPIAFAKVVAGWFDRHRGLALAIVLSAAPAIATAIMVVVAGRLIGNYGWRAAYQVFAASVIVIGLPVAFFFLREAQATEHSHAAGGMDARAEAKTAREARRSREFWLILLLTGLVCGVVQSMTAHFVAFSAERGVTMATATVALSAFSLVSPAGPLLAGALADRTRGPRPLVVFYSLPLFGLLLLLGFGPVAVVPAMVLLGLGFQAASGMLPYLLTRYFGVRHASQLFGVGLGVVTLSMGFGPVILGFARDQFNAFAATVPVLIVLLAGAILTVLLLPGYRQNSPPKDEQAGRGLRALASASLPLVLRLEPERAHRVAMTGLNLLRPFWPRAEMPPDIAVNCAGLQFAHPVGIAAGLDKDGDYLDALGAIGFSYIEIGTVTPRPQPGNPKPRLFRIPESTAVINRMGFNSKGVEYVVHKLQHSKFRGIRGVSIGKNAVTPIERAGDDYLLCFRAVYNHADYVAVNVSSPNTSRLRELQAAAALSRVIEPLQQARVHLAREHGKYMPIFVKLAPDLSSDELKSLAAEMRRLGIDGVIAANTTVQLDGVPGVLPIHRDGGLSGEPLHERVIAVIAQLRSELGPNVPIIGVGGITNARAALSTLSAGADLIQLYTGFVYRGPALLGEIISAIRATAANSQPEYPRVEQLK